ncbi:MAG: glycerophosphoryl diester phosphodiesterase membrane domain-containing protein [Erythrobacter sp.]|nr:glycerophosphoryl diester phosphodiesterase membrane domain-containing protein [Erythrobacter sp.]
MKLDLSAAWDGAMKMLAANREMVLVLAGVFIFLPTLAFSLLFPDPSAQASAAGAEPDMDAMYEQIAAFYAEVWWAVLLLSVIQAVGAIAILTVLGDGERPTVKEAIGRGVRFLPSQFAAQILAGLAALAPFLIAGAIGGLTGSPPVATVLILLAIPVGVYLIVKFSMSSPVIAIERTTNPIAALRRSWRLTKGNSGRLLLFILLLIVAFGIVSAILSLIFGFVFALGGEHIALVGNAIVASLINAGIACIIYAVLASLHHRFAAPTPSVPTTHED